MDGKFKVKIIDEKSVLESMIKIVNTGIFGIHVKDVSAVIIIKDVVGKKYRTNCSSAERIHNEFEMLYNITKVIGVAFTEIIVEWNYEYEES